MNNKEMVLFTAVYPFCLIVIHSAYVQLRQVLYMFVLLMAAEILWMVLAVSTPPAAFSYLHLGYLPFPEHGTAS
jgi:hypothetical protein